MVNLRVRIRLGWDRTHNLQSRDCEFDPRPFPLPSYKGLNALNSNPLWLLKEYLGKQWRPRWNAALCSISSGSTLFAKTKTIFRDEWEFYFEFTSCYPPIYTTDHSKYIVRVATQYPFQNSLTFHWLFPDSQPFSRPFWKANLSHFHPSTIQRFCTNIWTCWFNL